MGEETIGQLMLDIGVNNSMLLTGVNQASSIIQSFATTAKMALAGVGIYFGYEGIKGMVGKATDAYEKLNLAAIELGEVTGKLDPASLKAMEKTAQDLAIRYGIASEEILKVQKVLAISPFKTAAEQTYLLNLSLKAAVGSMTSAGATANALIRVMREYKMGTQDAAKVTDLLFEASNVSGVGFTEFSEGLVHIAPMARLAKADIGQVAAAMATMTRSGMSAGESSMALTRIIMAMSNPQKEALQVMQKMGISFRDSSGGLKDFMTVLSSFKGRGLSDIAELVGGTRQAMAVSKLANNIKEMQELSMKLRRQMEMGGATEEHFERMDATWTQHLNRMKQGWASLWEGAGRILTEVLGPIVERFTRFLGVVRTMFENHAAGIQAWIRSLADHIATFFWNFLEWVNALDEAGTIDEWVRRVIIGFYTVVDAGKALYNALKLSFNAIRLLFTEYGDYIRRYALMADKDQAEATKKTWEQIEKGGAAKLQARLNAFNQGRLINGQPAFKTVEEVKAAEDALDQLNKAYDYTIRKGQKWDETAFAHRQAQEAGMGIEVLTGAIDDLEKRMPALANMKDALKGIEDAYNDWIDAYNKHNPNKAKKGILNLRKYIDEWKKGLADIKIEVPVSPKMDMDADLAPIIKPIKVKLETAGALEKGSQAAWAAMHKTGDAALQAQKQTVKNTGETAVAVKTIAKKLDIGHSNPFGNIFIGTATAFP